MSASSLVAKRYANALFLLAKENKKVAAVEQDVKLIAEAVAAEPKLSAVLGHPGVDSEGKQKLIESVFANKVDESVLHVVQLMCVRNRADLLSDLATHFTKIAGRELGQVDAQVFSPEALSEKELKDIQKTFADLLGKEVRVQQTLNPDLIGGIQVRVGDTLYDGSLAGKLARLEKSLQESQVL